ncbi:MAG: hypothetical protein V7K40_01660 [Nostoc sp.]|uniref:hypothetical protein n=1 Tax=Nostoc sp. TaxID=1180 RepID=UPI002FF52C00
MPLAFAQRVTDKPLERKSVSPWEKRRLYASLLDAQGTLSVTQIHRCLQLRLDVDTKLR